VDSELIGFLSARFDEVRSDFGTVVEGLRHDLRAVSEGHAVIRHEIADLRRENTTAHEEIVAKITMSYRDLNQRLTRLESRSSELETRTQELESRLRRLEAS
jgi:uncharacterized protein (DUF3084 family)